jgi:hypothetical protein
MCHPEAASYVNAAIDSFHCTLAVTAAVPFNVKVQVFRLLPPLEHAPDQIASLPLLTARMTLVPEVNGACMELPTATLIPAGLDVTRSPLRPVADTVRTPVVTGGGAGFTVRGASFVRPPAVAKMVSPVDVATGDVGTEKETLVSPAGTMTVDGTVAIGLLLESIAEIHPAAQDSSPPGWRVWKCLPLRHWGTNRCSTVSPVEAEARP